ncbi:MAG TPA: hypothetical protein VM884_04015 [Flavisolibacter sp.]|jgi:anti-sigma factor RsiW|nr:hypothetical protein [Flavisolibacter sp.]
MKENLKDILSNLHSETDQQTLLNYLQGKLSAEQQHEVEKALLDDEFEAEALEGLQEFNNKRNISVLVANLDAELKKKTAKKKASRQKREIKLDPWLFIAIILILAIAIISFFVIYKMGR